MAKQIPTPGPWHVGEMHAGGINVRSEKRRKVTTVYAGDSTVAEASANARIIAAAPTMLDALRHIALQHHYLKLSPCGQAVLAVAQDAIAKAEGKE